jgi:hypothetical protein
LRSDREHCASRVAVEQEEEERRGGEEQATDIKSNNPHLAGGEHTKKCAKPMKPTGKPMGKPMGNHMGKPWEHNSTTVGFSTSIC